MNRTKHALLASLVCLSLSACKTWEDLTAGFERIEAPMFQPDPVSEDFLLNGNCPQIKLVDELDSLSEFLKPRRPRENELISRAFVTDVNVSCEYGPKSVAVDLKLDFKAQIGPQGRSKENDKAFFSYPFFVAVTSPDGKILAKEIFAASMSFEPGQQNHTYIENLRQIIPVSSPEKGQKHKIMIGFQLTEEQLDYNREVIMPKRRAAAKKAAEARKAQQEAAAARAEHSAPSSSAIESQTLGTP